MDRLAVLMERFPMAAQVFNAGALCGINTLESDGEHGQMHLVRSGRVEVFHGSQNTVVEQPSLLLYPRPLSHRFVTDADSGADLVCANLRFEGGLQNPVRAALPDFICLPLARIDSGARVLELLFEEAFEQRCGRIAIINRLFEVVMIHVLRELMESRAVQAGLLSGLGHPRLRNALVAMHEAPAKDWTLDELARVAGMSRSAFATQFRDSLGTTPGQYLQGWRVGLAQQALRRGRSLKVVATEVGYGSEAALSRAFKAHSGESPREWKRKALAA